MSAFQLLQHPSKTLTYAAIGRLATSTHVDESQVLSRKPKTSVYSYSPAPVTVLSFETTTLTCWLLFYLALSKVRATMKLQALRLSSSSSIVILFLLSASILPIVNALNAADSHNTLQQITFQSETAADDEFNASCVATADYPCCCNPCPAIMCPSFTPPNMPP